MHRGYIRLWRKSVDSGIIQNPKLWAFWTWCLLKASHKNHKQMVGTQIIDISPGQFVFGRKAASEELNISEQSIRTYIKKLKNLKNLTIKSTNKFSIISIINWDIYQQCEDETNQQINHHLTSNQPATNHKQEHKNIRTKELKKRERKTFSPPTLDEVKTYFYENGYSEYSAIKAFNYYSTADWKDSRGNQVKNWKQKMISVWFKEENKKINGKDTHNNFKEKTYECTPDAEISWLND